MFGVGGVVAGALATAVGGGAILRLSSATGIKSAMTGGGNTSSSGSSAASSSTPGIAEGVTSSLRTTGNVRLPIAPSNCHGYVSTCLYSSKCSLQFGYSILIDRESLSVPPTAVKYMSLDNVFVRKIPRCHLASPFCCVVSPMKTITGHPYAHSFEVYPCPPINSKGVVPALTVKRVSVHPA